MELFFLFLLIFIMAFALSSGYPLAFALPGSAIITITIAGLAGFIFEGNPNEYFISDGPYQWLNAGITNFRGVYWEVERDTLIAIPLFIFMGIMLEKSKIAEDLLISMGQLFGPMPGGLGISVIFVGALLAATTGIVGATVVAMGLISLPAMMKNNYNNSLASGIVCSSGTLGQIIPPSIVLIILSDQLASASDAADNLRVESYKIATGSMNMPGQFSVDSVSAGNMFLGAFLPGVVLVSLYMLYVLLIGIFKKEAVPPVKFEGKYNYYFFQKVFLALVPPLSLIFVVLGSILMGIATVNQAGAIGAVGAGIMGGYRLYEGKQKYLPAIISIISVVVIFIIVLNYKINIKTISSSTDYIVTSIAIISVLVLIFGISWSFWRTFKINNVLRQVMVETSITTSMVFIILIGAAMLTAAFRAFGGEEIVRDFLTSLPGGFWSQFIFVMIVIFILGFFLDFIEIAIVVVPIVAPILLAETSANITAVWLGVMIGVNMQTSFLTPPFGFSLFYLRGVAPKSIKTLDIWKGASVFILLQLFGLGIVGYFPQLVNYLPLRSYFTSEVSPPPLNPKLQDCLLEYKIENYSINNSLVISKIENIKKINIEYLSDTNLDKFNKLLSNINESKNLLNEIKVAENQLNEFSINYKPLHNDVRSLQRKISKYKKRIEKLEKEKRLETDESELVHIDEAILDSKGIINDIESSFPSNWTNENNKLKEILENLNKKKLAYNRSVDSSYDDLNNFIELFKNVEMLSTIKPKYDIIRNEIKNKNQDIENILKIFEKNFNDFNEVSHVKKPIKNVRKLLKKNSENINEAINLIDESYKILENEINWRLKGKNLLLNDLQDLSILGKKTFGLRKQDRLTKEQALYLASCKSVHEDISLYF